MFTLYSDITIGGRSFTGVNDVKIKRSVRELGATATIRVPVTAVLRQQGEPPARVETAQEVKVGDRVQIRLGYSDIPYLEFTGYVKMLNLRTPLEIVCEDEFYTTRSRRVTLQGRTTLREILRACGLQAGYAAELTLSSFQADDKPVAWVLSKLKGDYGLDIWFDLDGKVCAAESGKVVGRTVKYRLRENVISDDDLKYHLADDVRRRIKAVCILKDGSRIEAEAGPADGTEKKVYFYDVEDRRELAALAAAELKRYSYDGFSGRITTFLEPYAAPSMAAQIEDPGYSMRNGVYYIESVETTFGTGGARRTLEIGMKL